MNSPTSVAIDSNGYVYVTDGGGYGYGGYGYFGGYGGGSSSVRKFNNSATSTPIVSFNTSISNNCLAGVSQITIDPSGYLWATANSANSGCRVSNPGGAATFSYINQLYTPGNIAIDQNGEGWVALQYIGYVVAFTPSGQANGYGGFNVGGLSYPTWVAIDGSNNLWITNSGNSYALSEFNSSGAPITGYYGYQRGALNNPSFLAVDASGDVWVPNQSSNTVTEIIGAATPTVTPLSALQPGQRP
jgi:streptogramin lyase